MKKNVLFFLFITCSLLVRYGNAFEDEDSITVGLSTETALDPLYLTSIINNQSAFDEDHIKQLEKVLSFDLQHNGRTFLIQKSSEQERYATAGKFEQMGFPAEWKKQNIFYVVKPRISGKTVSAMMLDTHKQLLKKTDPITLTGDLSQDRRLIHKLADSIYKGLFDSEGIASTKIIYTVKNISGKDEGLSEIWESDYDGGNPRQITHLNTLCVSPVYIPPKPGYVASNVLYTSYQLGQPKIYIGSLKGGSTAQRLSYMRGNQLMPAISRQRDKIAFISDVTGNPDLFLLSFSTESGAIGKPQQIFSAKQATQGSPTFSPEGERIAFVSNKAGSPRVYVIDVPEPGASLKNIKATLISKQNRESTAPSWSPDGTKIAYCSRQQGDRQIWIYDFRTGQEKQVTKGPGNKENPSWAPNSLHLVFNTADRDRNDIHIISLNESESVKITSSKGQSSYPSWEPRVER